MINDPHLEPELSPAAQIPDLAKIVAGSAAGFWAGLTLLGMVKSCCHTLAMLAGLFVA